MTDDEFVRRAIAAYDLEVRNRTDHDFDMFSRALSALVNEEYTAYDPSFTQERRHTIAGLTFSFEHGGSEVMVITACPVCGTPVEFPITSLKQVGQYYKMGLNAMSLEVKAPRLAPRCPDCLRANRYPPP